MSLCRDFSTETENPGPGVGNTVVLDVVCCELQVCLFSPPPRYQLRWFLSSLQTVAIFRSMKSVLRSTATPQQPRTVCGPGVGP